MCSGPIKAVSMLDYIGTCTNIYYHADDWVESAKTTCTVCAAIVSRALRYLAVKLGTLIQ